MLKVWMGIRRLRADEGLLRPFESGWGLGSAHPGSSLKRMSGGEIATGRLEDIITLLRGTVN
ncbi:hypothetical protein [Enterovirga sp.]|uniref:hypothetical protein n=1 Tax=Enterovirga sp. TaxID=2026350 RepID=UPI002BCAF652|nr:hypothetical protein [Enterovirga sp.]